MIIKNGKTISSVIKGNQVIDRIMKGTLTVYEAFKNLIASGVPPLTLNKCKGVDLLDYKIYGESVQNGTPTPTTPIEVESVGERTINLFKLPLQGNSVVNVLENGLQPKSNSRCSINTTISDLEVGKTYTCKIDVEDITDGSSGQLIYTDGTNHTYIRRAEDKNNVRTFTLKEGVNYNQLWLYGENTKYLNIMIVEGEYTAETFPNYEPYGYKIPVKARGINLIDEKTMQTGYIGTTGNVMGNHAQGEKISDYIYCMFCYCDNLGTVPDMDLSSVFGSNLTSDALECGSMFSGCKNLKTVGKLTTPNTHVFSTMFDGCQNLTYIPDMDFDSAVRMNSMFRGCPIVGDYVIDARNCVTMYDIFSFSATDSKYKGDLNLSLKVCNDPNSPVYGLVSTQSSPPKYVQMYRAFQYNANLKSLELDGYIGGSLDRCFYSCSNLESLSFNCDFSKVTGVTYMFQYCNKLKSIPDMNLSSVTTFMGTNASYAWLLYCNSLKSIGVIDCDSCTQVGHLVPASTTLTDLAGFRNLGKASTISGADGNYFLYQTPNLTYESLTNVINMLYDRAANGLSTVTIKLHTNHMAMLNESDILVATNKGWILTA